MKNASLAVMLLSLFASGCSSKPVLLSGKDRHRVPINTVAELVSATPPPPAASVAPPVVVRRNFATYRYHFAFNKTDLLIPSGDSQQLLLDAMEASVIHIRGRTDGAQHSRGDETIAHGRATAAKNYLVSRGIDPAKLHIDVVSGGGYLAPNNSEAGRALNRRVEIQPSW